MVGKKFFVNEEFSEATASIRKGLLQKAKDLRLVVYEKERGNDIFETQ